jgi:hypothetical protein
MNQRLKSPSGLAASTMLGVLLSCCMGSPWTHANPLAALPFRQGANPAVAQPDDPWYQAIGAANRATQLASTAATAPQWNQVAGAWGQAVALLQDLPPEDPRQVFGQRKAREYQHNLYLAQQRADQQGMPRAFPALGSDVLDEQVSLYRAYVAAQGPPDVLIVGSSRALQGVDPQVLQQALAAQGHPGLRVYNFSINGATAQVVGFVLRQLLAPDLHPQMVIWAEGSRGFNSGRFDRTFAAILDSQGYTAVRAGANLTLAEPPTAAVTDPEATKTDYGTVPLSPINAQGFLAVNDQFNPAVYYRSFPRVRGQYDNAYHPFRLEGVQTVSFAATTEFLRRQGIPLVFVNLPLSNDYLDSVRLGYERQFQQFLQGWANRGSLTLVDLLEIWRWQSHLFADPSHINRYGAREIAWLLATSDRIAWPQATPAPTPDPAPDDDPTVSSALGS